MTSTIYGYVIGRKRNDEGMEWLVYIGGEAMWCGLQGLIVLDDLELPMAQLIQTDPFVGLTQAHIDEIIKQLEEVTIR